MGKQNRNSGKKENRKEKIEIKGRDMAAKCNVKIEYVSLSGEYEVTLSVSEDSEYVGISTTNGFESFANEIKSKYLPKVRNSKIIWFEKLVFENDSYKNFIREVELDWSWFKQSYSNFKPQRVAEWV